MQISWNAGIIAHSDCSKTLEKTAALFERDATDRRPAVAEGTAADLPRKSPDWGDSAFCARASDRTRHSVAKASVRVSAGNVAKCPEKNGTS